MTTPFVSVLITSFNREKYIAEAIESILNQSFTDFELIIVDDCSSDNTYEIIKSYSEKDSRVRCYQNEKNIGQFPNRNKAANFAKAPLIKYLDSDDILFSDALQCYINYMLLNPSANVAISVKNTLGAADRYRLISGEQALLEHYTQGKSFLYTGPSGCMFKKTAFQKLGGFNTNNGILNDTLLMLQLAEMGDVLLIYRDLFFWRLHNGQVTVGQEQEFKMILERHEINKRILLNNHSPLDTNTRIIIFKRLKKILARNLIFKILIKFQFNKFYRAYNCADLTLKEFIFSCLPSFNKKYFSCLMY